MKPEIMGKEFDNQMMDSGQGYWSLLVMFAGELKESKDLINTFKFLRRSYKFNRKSLIQLRNHKLIDNYNELNKLYMLNIYKKK